MTGTGSRARGAAAAAPVFLLLLALLLACKPASSGLPGDLKECNDKTIPLMDCPSGAFVSPDDMYNPYLMQALGAGRAEENIIKIKNGAASAAKWVNFGSRIVTGVAEIENGVVDYKKLTDFDRTWRLISLASDAGDAAAKDAANLKYMKAGFWGGKFLKGLSYFGLAFGVLTDLGVFGGSVDPAYEYFKATMEELALIEKGIQNLAVGVQKGFQKLSDSLSCQMSYYSQLNLQQTQELLDNDKIAQYERNTQNVMNKMGEFVEGVMNCLKFNSDYASAKIPPSASAAVGKGCAFNLGAGVGAEACKKYKDNPALWNSTWGTYGYKGGEACSIGGTSGLCDISGDCYQYVTPKAIAEDLWRSVAADFLDGNVLSTTFLSFSDFKGFDSMLAVAKAGAIRHAVMSMIWQLWQGSLDTKPGGAKNLIVSGSNALYKDLQQRMDYLFQPERTNAMMLNNVYYNPPAWAMESRGGCDGAGGCDKARADCSKGLESLRGPCELDKEGCTFITPPGVPQAQGVPPGSFVLDYKCTGDSLLFIAGDCYAAASPPGKTVTKTCLVGPREYPNGTLVNVTAPFITDDACINTTYSLNPVDNAARRPIVLDAVKYLTPDGKPCNMPRMGGGELCYVEVTYHEAPEPLLNKYNTTKTDVSCLKDPCINCPRGGQCGPTKGSYFACPVNWPKVRFASSDAQRHTGGDLQRCAKSWGCSWNANGHYAGAGAAFPYSWEECHLTLKADDEPRARVPCQEVASYKRQHARNVWVCAPGSDWSSAGDRDAPDGRYCYVFATNYSPFKDWKWATLDAGAKLSTVMLDGQQYMCNLAPMGGDTPISAEYNGDIVRTFGPGQVCNTPATGKGLFSKTQRVSTDAFPETVDKKEGAGCRTSPLSWLDTTTRDRKVDPSPLYRPGSPSLNVFKSAANLTSGEIKDPGYNSTFAPALSAWMQAAGALLQSKLASVMMDPAQLVNTTSKFRVDIPDAGLVTPDNSLWLMSVDGRWDDETNQNPWIYKQSFNQTTASQFTDGRVEDPAGGVMIGINFTTVKAHTRAAQTVVKLAAAAPSTKLLQSLRVTVDLDQPCVSASRLQALANSYVASISRALSLHNVGVRNEQCADAAGAAAAAAATAPDASVITALYDLGRPCDAAAHALRAPLRRSFERATGRSDYGVIVTGCHDNGDSGTSTFTLSLNVTGACPAQRDIDALAANALARTVRAHLPAHAARLRFAMCAAQAAPPRSIASTWSFDLVYPSATRAQASAIAQALSLSRVGRIMCTSADQRRGSDCVHPTRDLGVRVLASSVKLLNASNAANATLSMMTVTLKKMDEAAVSAVGVGAAARRLGSSELAAVRAWVQQRATAAAGDVRVVRSFDGAELTSFTITVSTPTRTAATRARKLALAVNKQPCGDEAASGGFDDALCRRLAAVGVETGVAAVEFYSSVKPLQGGGEGGAGGYNTGSTPSRLFL